MDELELKYEDYVEETIIDDNEKNNGMVSGMYTFINDYNKNVGYGEMPVNVGYSLKNGFFTYGKSGDNYEMMKMGNDPLKAFLRIVIYNIELPILNRVFSTVMDTCRNPELEDKLTDEEKNLIYKVTFDLPKFKNDFERTYPDVEFKNIMYYPTYILRNLRKYYDGLPIGTLEFDSKNNKVNYIGGVPFYVMEFFERYLRNATGMEWSFNGIDFVPVRNNENTKTDTVMTRKRVSE